MTCIYEEFLMMLEIISCGMKQSMSFWKNEKDRHLCIIFQLYKSISKNINALWAWIVCVCFTSLFVIQTLGAYFL